MQTPQFEKAQGQYGRVKRRCQDTLIREKLENQEDEEMHYLNHMKEEKNRFWQNSLSTESIPSRKRQK